LRRKNGSDEKVNVPSEGHTETGVEETNSESVETSGNRVENAHFTDSLSNVDKHDTDN